MIKKSTKFISSMVVLIISIIIGFILLSMVYRGSVFVEAFVILFVLIILFALIKITIKLAKSLIEIEKK